MVLDAEFDSEFAPYWPVVRAAGYRAVQSFPMVERDGHVIGVISTHFGGPGVPSAVNMHLMNALARHSAEMISRFGSAFPQLSG